MWFSVHAALLMGSATASGDEPEAAPARQVRDAEVTTADRAKANPAQGARHAKLMGAGNCSWSTSRMAARALSDGLPYTFVGHLEASDNALPSRVATPYTVGPDAAIHVVANEVLGLMERESVIDERLDVRGRIVEVGGVRYLVITDFTLVGA
ncbi:MAG: hypothetical protein AAF211_26010 [Myxococcota bacterium]